MFGAREVKTWTIDRAAFSCVSGSSAGGGYLEDRRANGGPSSRQILALSAPAAQFSTINRLFNFPRDAVLA